MTRIALHHGRLVTVHPLTARMRRIRLGGLHGFTGGREADERFTLILPANAGRRLELPASVDSAAVFGERPWPVTLRTFTVRRFDPSRGELYFDLALHPGGVAHTWALRAQAGDPVGVAGPRGGYVPAPDVRRFVLAGDHAALPAIATILERLPADVDAEVLVELEDGADELPLASAAALRCTWLRRGGTPRGTHSPLAAAVRALPPYDGGTTAVWAAGEVGTMHAIRHHLRHALRLPESSFQVCGFWREHDLEQEAGDG